MSKKPITTEELQIIASMRANNQSVHAIRKITGLHGNTINKVLDEPATRELIEQAGKLLAEKMLLRADQIIDSISDEDIFKAGLRDKTVAAAVLQDKARQSYGFDKPLTAIQVNLNDCSPFDFSKYKNNIDLDKKSPLSSSK